MQGNYKNRALAYELRMKRHSIAAAPTPMNQTVRVADADFALEKNRKELGHIMRGVDGFMQTFQAKRNSVEPTQRRLLSPLNRQDTFANRNFSETVESAFSKQRESRPSSFGEEDCQQLQH